MMKKLITLSMTALMFIAVLCTQSCSTTSSISKAFEKNGYVMSSLTPAQQAEICPVINKFPLFSQNAIGYLQSGNSCTFIYSADQSVWESYKQSLLNNGFSDMSIGFIKADKSAGLTYNVSAKPTVIYKQNFLLVTYVATNF